MVVGTRFEATLLEKYLPHHPPACEVDDPVVLELYRKKIRTEGALLIAPGNRKDRPPEKIFENFFQEIGCTQPVIFEKHTYYYQAKFGKKKKRIYYLGFLPPQEPSNRKPDNVINTNVLPEK